MDSNEFLVASSHLAAFIVRYKQTIAEIPVAPNIDPGYLRKVLPSDAPVEHEDFLEILADVEKHIVYSTTHWNHPHFYAYFPTGNGYPSILGDMISTGLGMLGGTWENCPGLNELEIHVVDMFGKLINLPDSLLYSKSNKKGGGCIQNSASESVYYCMLAARNREIKRLRRENPEIHYFDYYKKLVCYGSEQAHSSLEKAALVQDVIFRKILPDWEDDSMRAEDVEKVIGEDVAAGLHPFFILACIGTTGTAAIDDTVGISQLVNKYPQIWLHVDAAYSGNAFMLEEFKPLTEALAHVDSLSVNPYKWCLMAPEGSVLWLSDRKSFSETFSHEPRIFNALDLAHSPNDLCNYGFAFSRRFRCLKLWFTLRSYGKRGLERVIRNHIKLAKYLGMLIADDQRFKVMNKIQFGLVCFRLKKSLTIPVDDLNTELLYRLNQTGKIHMIPTVIKERVVIRFSVNYEFATEEHINSAWDLIQTTATELIQDQEIHIQDVSYLDSQVFSKRVSQMLAENGFRSLDFDTVVNVSQSQMRKISIGGSSGTNKFSWDGDSD